MGVWGKAWWTRRRRVLPIAASRLHNVVSLSEQLLQYNGLSENFGNCNNGWFCETWIRSVNHTWNHSDSAYYCPISFDHFPDPEIWSKTISRARRYDQKHQNFLQAILWSLNVGLDLHNTVFVFHFFHTPILYVFFSPLVLALDKISINVNIEECSRP